MGIKASSSPVFLAFVVRASLGTPYTRESGRKATMRQIPRFRCGGDGSSSRTSMEVSDRGGQPGVDTEADHNNRNRSPHGQRPSPAPPSGRAAAI